MTTSDEQRTLGEVARRLDELFSRYETIANNLPLRFVAKDVYDQYKELVQTREDATRAQIGALEKRIVDLESDKTWLYRLIVGAVILALLALVVGTTRNFGSSSPPKSMQQQQQLQQQVVSIQ